MIGFLALVAASDPPPIVEPQQQCAVGRATRFAERFVDVPAEIRNNILRTGKIAEAGESYSDTDAILDVNLPTRRFVRGGRSGPAYFVWTESGGYVSYDEVIGFWHVWEDNELRRHRVAELQGEPCVAINAFLSGVRTNVSGEP